MKLLLDTHLLIWAASATWRLSPAAKAELGNRDNTLVFSAASLWEIAIKRGMKRPDFTVDVRVLRRGLRDSGYIELPVTSEHAIAVEGLPLLHKDPFDRLLIAQAIVEGITLVTGDELVAKYPAPVRLL